MLSYFALSSEARNEVNHCHPCIINTHLRLFCFWTWILSFFFFKSCAFIIKISSQLAHTYQTTATNLMLFSLKRRENFRKPKDADFRRDLIWDTSEFQDHPGLTCRLVALGYGSAAARVWPQVVKKWSSQRQQSLLTVFCLHRAHSIQKKMWMVG